MASQEEFLSGEGLVNYYCFAIGINGDRESKLKESVSQFIDQVGYLCNQQIMK